MKTIAQVKRDYPQYKGIIQAVINGLNSGKDDVQDVNQYGISGGYGKFIYHSDTVKFWKTWKKSILAMLADDSDSFGEPVISIVQNFNCLCFFNGSLKDRTMEYTQDEIGKALYGRHDDDLTSIYNALAWYAAETVCRWFED